MFAWLLYRWDLPLRSQTIVPLHSGTAPLGKDLHQRPPHHEIRLKIYARLGHNGVGRSAEDSLQHILRRQLGSENLKR